MQIDLQGTFFLECIHNGKKISRQFSNAVVSQGKNHLLDTMFGSEAKDTWYFGLIDTKTTLSTADTLASHSGWTETTDYTGDRKAVVFASAASELSITSDLAEFTMEAEKEIVGAFICNAETDTTGILWSHGLFTAFTAPDESVVKVRYNLKVKA